MMSHSFAGRSLVRSVSAHARSKNFSTTFWMLQQVALKENIQRFPIKDYLKPLEDPKKLWTSFVNESHINRKVLLAPDTYTRMVSTNGILPNIIDGYNYWMQVPEEKYQTVEEAAYLIYETVTMVDDIVDDADLRRDHPTALRIYGSDRTWIASISAAFEAIENLLSLKEPKAVSAVCHNLMLVMASIAQYDRVKNYSGYPSIEEFFKIAIGKNGAFFQLICDIMQAHSNCELDFSRLNRLLGIYTQIQNDSRIFLGGNVVNGKIYADDIESGTFNFPLCLAADKNNLEADIVFNIVKKKTKDSTIKDYCIKSIHKLEVQKEAKRFQIAFFEEVMKEIERLGGNPVMAGSLEKIQSQGMSENFKSDTASE